MKVRLAKKIKHFVLNVLKAIGIVFLCILAGDIFSLAWNGGHTYEVYKSRFLINDLHDEGFYVFITFVVLSIVLAYFAEWDARRKNRKK